jgi:hypothetical protein
MRLAGRAGNRLSYYVYCTGHGPTFPPELNNQHYSCILSNTAIQTCQLPLLVSYCFICKTSINRHTQ